MPCCAPVPGLLGRFSYACSGRARLLRPTQLRDDFWAGYQVSASDGSEATMTDRALATAVLAQHEGELLGEWVRRLKQDGALAKGAGGAVLEAQCASFLQQFRLAAVTGQDNVDAVEFEPVRDVLNE